MAHGRRRTVVIAAALLIATALMMFGGYSARWAVRSRPFSPTIRKGPLQTCTQTTVGSSEFSCAWELPHASDDSALFTVSILFLLGLFNTCLLFVSFLVWVFHGLCRARRPLWLFGWAAGTALVLVAALFVYPVSFATLTGTDGRMGAPYSLPLSWALSYGLAVAAIGVALVVFVAALLFRLPPPGHVRSAADRYTERLESRRELPFADDIDDSLVDTVLSLPDRSLPLAIAEHGQQDESPPMRPTKQTKAKTKAGRMLSDQANLALMAATGVVNGDTVDPLTGVGRVLGAADSAIGSNQEHDYDKVIDDHVDVERRKVRSSTSPALSPMSEARRRRQLWQSVVDTDIDGKRGRGAQETGADVDATMQAVLSDIYHIPADVVYDTLELSSHQLIEMQRKEVSRSGREATCRRLSARGIDPPLSPEPIYLEPDLTPTSSLAAGATSAPSSSRAKAKAGPRHSMPECIPMESLAHRQQMIMTTAHLRGKARHSLAGNFLQRTTPSAPSFGSANNISGSSNSSGPGVSYGNATSTQRVTPPEPIYATIDPFQHAQEQPRRASDSRPGALLADQTAYLAKQAARTRPDSYAAAQRQPIVLNDDDTEDDDAPPGPYGHVRIPGAFVSEFEHDSYIFAPTPSTLTSALSHHVHQHPDHHPSAPALPPSNSNASFHRRRSSGGSVSGHGAIVVTHSRPADDHNPRRRSRLHHSSDSASFAAATTSTGAGTPSCMSMMSAAAVSSPYHSESNSSASGERTRPPVAAPAITTPPDSPYASIDRTPKQARRRLSRDLALEAAPPPGEDHVYGEETLARQEARRMRYEQPQPQAHAPIQRRPSSALSSRSSPGPNVPLLQWPFRSQSTDGAEPTARPSSSGSARDDTVSVASVVTDLSSPPASPVATPIQYSRAGSRIARIPSHVQEEF